MRKTWLRALEVLSTGWIMCALVCCQTDWQAVSASPLLINGAGATFPYPLYSKWFDAYAKIDPTVRFNYQSIGSGAGRKQIAERTVDFAATDSPMLDNKLGKGSDQILHLPTVAGAVAIAYNLPSRTELHLTGELLAEIFAGKILKWNDHKIAQQNPGMRLPAMEIIVIHRSESSGTSHIFSDYLCRISTFWRKEVGCGAAIRWPSGLGAKGNEGVTGQIKQLPGAVGYVELAYAQQNGLATAAIQNRQGQFVAPTLASIGAALSAVEVSEDLRFSIVDSHAADAYPICGATWLLVYASQKDQDKGQKLVSFLNWALTEGENFAPPLGYAPLPERLRQQVLARVRTITF